MCRNGVRKITSVEPVGNEFGPAGGPLVLIAARADPSPAVGRVRQWRVGLPCGVGDHTAVATLTRYLRGLSRPALLGCFAAVVGWLVVGLLPWWQVRSDWADGTGSGTHVYGASAWQASTPASITVLVAAVTTVALIITTDRGWRPRTRVERSGVLAAAWLLPAVLLLWLGWTVNRDTAIGPAILTMTDVVDGDPLPPEPQVIRDHLDYQHWPGYSEGPAWGLFLGVLLVVAVSVWVTARTVRAPAS
jgi:hypothetical protein